MGTQAANEPLVLALDVGTSSVRAALFNARGRMVPASLQAVQHAPRATPDGGSELDPDEVLDRCCTVTDLALASAAAPPVAVAVSAFWHSVMGIDERGRPTTPVYTWADTRSAGAVQLLRERLDEAETYRRTGCPLHSSYLPAKLLWLRDARPEQTARTRRWVSFAEYAQLRLLGESACGTAMASATGLYDQAAQSWDEEVLRVVGIGPDALSPLVPTGRPVGSVRRTLVRRWPLLAGVPWLPAIGDGACANLGSGAGAGGRVALSFGTSGAVRTVVNEVQPFPTGLWLYRLDERRLVLGGALSNAGNVYRWLVTTLRISERDAARALLEHPPPVGLVFTPRLAGERSPGWRPDATGTLAGLRLAHSPSDIFAAGMAGVLRDFSTVHSMLHGCRSNLGPTIMSGGAVRRPGALRQALADALGAPVRAALEPEPSARGAALLAFEALGALPDAAAVPTRLSKEYLPRVPGAAQEADTAGTIDAFHAGAG